MTPNGAKLLHRGLYTIGNKTSLWLVEKPTGAVEMAAVEMAAVYIEGTEIFLSHKAGQFFKQKVRR